MPWRSFFETGSGRLESVGSVWGPLPPGWDFLETVDRPSDDDMWDEGLLNYIPRPPKVRIDRMDDLETHPSYQQFIDVFDALSNPDKAKVRNAIRKLLHAEQFRNISEDIKIGG